MDRELYRESRAEQETSYSPLSTGQELVSVSHELNVGYIEMTFAKEILNPSKGLHDPQRGLDTPPQVPR